MSQPRQVLPGKFWMITRRTTQRQFLLRPDDETNNGFAYCLAEAAERFQIDIILPSVLSNHHHTIVFDRYGRLVEFMAHFHKMTAKSQNSLRGRWENLWASEEVSAVELIDREDVLNKLVYAATNPVKDGLVERVHQWPGLNGTTALLNDRPIHTTRPRHFFRTEGPMPAEVTLNLVIPPELGDAGDIRSWLRQAIAEFEERIAAERARTGAKIVGRRAILRTSWRASPNTNEPRRRLRPRFAALKEESRLAALRRYHVFKSAYREARAAWLAGWPTVFPAGTYWLRRFANVPVATAC